MLGQATYAPLLHSRVAEMKALVNLSEGAKDRLFPILSVRPSPRARHLSKTYEKIERAIGKRRFGFELDRSKFGSGGEGAALEFDRLFDAAGGYLNYYDAVSSVEGAVPVLRLSEPIDLVRQLAHIEAIDRGAIVRLQYGATGQALVALRAILASTPDVLVVIDAGWSRDLLGREAWASGVIGTVTDLAPEPELVVMGSSFPDSFTHVGKRAEITVLERTLHANLVRRHNEAMLIYGDWGSTRPPTVDAGPMRNTPRIDLPTNSRWLCFRKTEDEGYPQIAQRLMKDAAWKDDVSTWGAYVIASTAEGLPNSIRSPGTAAAARINIHLQRQAYADLAEVPSGEGEELYIDI